MPCSPSPHRCVHDRCVRSILALYFGVLCFGGWITAVAICSVAFYSVAFDTVALRAEDPAPPTYHQDIAPLLTKYCVGCHNATEYEAGLQMHRFSALTLGGDSGTAIVPGKPHESLLWRRVSGLEDPKMPPPEAPQPTPEELAPIEAWILSGAEGSDRWVPLKERWTMPRARKPFRGASPITAAAVVGPSGLLLLGRHDALEIQQAQWRSRLDVEIIGKVTQLRTSDDGRWVVVCTGIPGVGGQTLVLDATTLSPSQPLPRVLQRVEGHSDIVYAAALSPDGTRLATAGYDRVIQVWDVSSGNLWRSLEGHNGAVYDLDIDSTGQVLASASADETIKIWRIDTGERLDTFGQCEAEQYAVRFDDKRGLVVAAGADRRVRTWQLRSKEKPTVSPLVRSIFAQEAAVNQLAFSKDARWAATAGDDRGIKIWNAETWQMIRALDPSDDVATSLVWNADGNGLLITTMAGSLEQRDVQFLQQLHSEPTLTDVKVQSIAVDALRATPTDVNEEPASRSLSSPQLLPIPSIVQATLTEEDMRVALAGDWYAIDVQQGEEWILSIDAARSGSPMDSLLDIYSKSGEPLLRTRLQAVRESYFTFRGKDSTNIDDFRLHRWEDMELNQSLYAGGEVVRLWLYPRGPDSGFKVYPGFGNRFTYFDTTATTHALNEPCWIVEELGLDQEPAANGLPVFPIYYSNDDDAMRSGGKDSKLHFRAPYTGRFLIRVRDTRGQSGKTFTYKLIVRRPESAFKFELETKEVTLREGVGAEFSVAIERLDGFEAPVHFEFQDIPEGITVSRELCVERGQWRAIGQIRYDPTLYASLPKEFEIKIKPLVPSVLRNDGTDQVASLKVRLSDKPAMPLKLIARDAPIDSPALAELRVRRGSTTSAQLVIERGELQGDIALGGDDSGRNLPHGCFVDNIGLSGLLIPAGQSTREVFITAAPTTEPQERVFHLRAQVDGNPTTLPVRLIVE